MKTTFGSNAKFFLVTAGLWLLLLISYPQSAVAQTNTFPASGNAGIGTTSPTEKLEVVGTVKSSGGLTITGAPGEPSYLNALYLGMTGNTATIDAVDQMVDFRDLVISAKTFRVNTWNGGGLVTGLFQNNNGYVGIGTSAPGYLLDVQGNAQWVARFKKTDATNGGIIVDAATGYNPNLALSVNGAVKWYMNSNTSNGDTLQFWESTGATPRFTLTQAGNVGIGTTTPSASYKLDVNGGINASNINSTGNITASGSIAAKYQDVAEWVPAGHALPAGTVVTLDPTKSNHVEASSQSYDTRVAGVVSEQPGITLGESGENKVLVATTGRVRVTVDASHDPIHIGDLLVTSDMPGVAMKSEPITIGGRQIHSPGTLIGKALEPLEKGSGKILVLLSLQ